MSTARVSTRKFKGDTWERQQGFAETSVDEAELRQRIERMRLRKISEAALVVIDGSQRSRKGP